MSITVDFEASVVELLLNECDAYKKRNNKSSRRLSDRERGQTINNNNLSCLARCRCGEGKKHEMSTYFRSAVELKARLRLFLARLQCCL